MQSDDVAALNLIDEDQARGRAPDDVSLVQSSQSPPAVTILCKRPAEAFFILVTFPTRFTPAFSNLLNEYLEHCSVYD